MVTPTDYYIAAFVGSLVIWFKLKSEGKAVITFINWLAPERFNRPWARLCEPFLFAAAGCFATMLTKPTSSLQAFVEGVGFMSAIQAYSKSGPPVQAAEVMAKAREEQTEASAGEPRVSSKPRPKAKPGTKKKGK